MAEDKDEKMEQLVLMAKKGDTDAFAALYDMLANQVYRYIYFKVDRDDVEDLTEMTFLRVWENIHKYKRRKTSFSAWVFKIAHNLVVDHYRLRRSTAELKPDIPAYDRTHNPVSVVEDSLNQDILREALRHLKKNYREIIVLKFLNELSNKEIARILKKSEGSLRVLQMRALRSLRKVLKNIGVRY